MGRKGYVSEVSLVVIHMLHVFNLPSVSLQCNKFSTRTLANKVQAIVYLTGLSERTVRRILSDMDKENIAPEVQADESEETTREMIISRHLVKPEEYGMLTQLM